MASPRILVVEDEILIAREIEGCLSELGYCVVGIAADAESALRQIVEAEPDLVLVDIVIQGEQDGIALAGQIRDRFQLPVVYLTAYVDDQTLARAKLTQPFGYILKPFNKNGLRVTVEIALARHQAEIAQKRELLFEMEKPSLDHTDLQPFEYLSILSHELRNPIAAIQLSTTMLGEYSDRMDEAKKRELLQRIQAATGSMNQLIEDVLTLGQVDHNSTPFHPEDTDVIEFCQTLVETFQWSTEHRYTIAFTYPVEQIQTCVDKKLLWHALTNLLGNAIKYSPEGNTVALHLSYSQQELYFEIQDHGIGIPPEDLEHLFQPFRRGKNVGKLPGTGLGLAIAKRAVELHNGEISVNSQIGTGTTFMIKLPVLQTRN
ncbi:response regulator [Kovacikia minuta CCNUW1]|uniref:hybrid sensor histidine kinase/response regulator n=1 Tax=Kovacikia minuta TaxID=2931930 RepID=UPI001CCBF09D|nr:ATP-binding protein [Kovacikia minuta]UBF28336.1 response regulator [Kovacikia minuta CCNUW1]